SIPIRIGGNFPRYPMTCRRRSFLHNIGCSAAFTPCNTKTLLDVSIPLRIRSFTDGSLCLRSATTSFWHSDAVGGRPPQQGRQIANFANLHWIPASRFARPGHARNILDAVQLAGRAPALLTSTENVAQE